MSSLIEQAAQRLAQIRQSGIEIPGEGQDAPAAQSKPVVRPVRSPSIEAASPRSPSLAQPSLHSTSTVDEASANSRRVELNLEQLSAAGIVTPHAPRSQLADQFRVIKRPLINNATGQGVLPVNNGNLIMVTSALPGEGKSFTSISLAMSIAAELDHTVMLVDADVARPSILRMLGLPPGPGLLDLLEGKADMSSV